MFFIVLYLIGVAVTFFYSSTLSGRGFDLGDNKGLVFMISLVWPILVLWALFWYFKTISRD